MNRICLCISSVLLATVVSACGKGNQETSTPPETSPSVDDKTTTPSPDGGKQTSNTQDSTAQDGNRNEKDPTPSSPGSAVCDAEVTEAPVALFNERVLIRPPKGVDLVEIQPNLARITSSSSVSTCDAIVSMMLVGYFEPDPKVKFVDYRDQVLEARGIPKQQISGWSEETAKDRSYEGSYSVPESEKGEPPIQGWFVMKEVEGLVFWTLYETHPNAWDAVRKSFQESGRRLFVVPANP